MASTLKKVFGQLGEATELLQTKVTEKDGRRKVEKVVLNEQLNNASLASILNILKQAVESLTEFVQEEQQKEDDSVPEVSRVRQVEDELDEIKQKRMIGKFIITSVAKPGKECLIKSDAQFEEDETLVDHVIKLAKTKYGTEVRKSDVLECKRLQSGAILLTLWVWYDSSFHTLAASIKSSKNFDTNVFFNFMLTKRRNELCFHVRQLKRDKKIDKFFSDERGHITIKYKEKSQKISSLPLDTNKYIKKTYTITELETLITQWNSNQ